MDTIVRQAVIEHRRDRQEFANNEWEKKYAGIGPRLHVSEIGHCPRAAYLRMAGCEPIPFDDYVMALMHSGNVWESENSDALQEYYGMIERQVLVDNGTWVGTADYTLTLDGMNYVIEHKDSSDANFRYGNRLPYDFHVYQVLLYARLLEKQTGEPWNAILYYNGRGPWAEFEVNNMPDYFDGPNAIIYDGYVNGKEVSGEFDTTIKREMAKIKAYWPDRMPPVYPSPTEFDVQWGCTKPVGPKKYRSHMPSCKWWKHCWPNLPYYEPVT
jgi:CRISPR/Cas system-associated exonuclease Cas4 (RecB family)